MTQPSAPTALGHFRILDLAGTLGAYCTRLLADMGADVIKIEPPDGDTGRGLAPFAGDEPGPERSLWFINFNHNKRSIVLDLEQEADRATFRELAATADAVIESLPVGKLASLGLGYDDLAKINPGLVVTSITPFGQTGPYASYLGNDLIGNAMGGITTMQGDPEMPPCMAPLEQGPQMASIHAGFATLAALWERLRSGLGQHVDVSLQEVEAHRSFLLQRYSTTWDVLGRPGGRSSMAPNSIYACKDGNVAISVFNTPHFKVLADWMQEPTLLDPMWEQREARRDQGDIIDMFVREFTQQFTMLEFTEEAQRRKIPVTPLNTTATFSANPHVKFRNIIIDAEHPVIGKFRTPGAPFRFSGTPWRLHRPAPLLGQHTQEVLEELKGMERRAVVGTEPGAPRRRPLEGIRILDFTRVWAGPFGTRYLGELGAEIIKIESRKFADGRGDNTVPPALIREREASFAEINRNKRSITLDMNDPKGRELAKQLVAQVDIVIENFSPRIMERWELDYPQLKEIKDDIILISMPGLGKSGPARDYVSYGGNLMAFLGLGLLWGHPESDYAARCKLAYPDYIAAAKEALVVLTALHHRQRTGQGQFIEMAQVDGAAAMMGVAFLDYSVNGRVWDATGNTNPNSAPHNVYPTLGIDRWVAIACDTEPQWRALVQGMDNPAWARDPKFATKASRHEHRLELDAYVGEWTQSFTPHQVMHKLQRLGVPAGVCATNEDVYHDFHLRDRGFAVELSTPATGLITYDGLTTNLSATPGRVEPLVSIGNDNDDIFLRMLGLPEDQYRSLIAEGVIE